MSSVSTTSFSTLPSFLLPLDSGKSHFGPLDFPESTVVICILLSQSPVQDQRSQLFLLNIPFPSPTPTFSLSQIEDIVKSPWRWEGLDSP